MVLVGIHSNPVPSKAVSGHISVDGDISIRYARWPAAGSERRGTVCIFPGRGEFIEKYFETVADLRGRGFAVAAMDWRGQGGSTRLLSHSRKGHIETFRQYDSDLVHFMREIVLPDCPAPHFALAHSMGGNILLRAARRKSWFDRMVLCSPMIELAPWWLPEGLIGGLAEFFTYAGFGASFVPGGTATASECTPFKNNRLTSDPARLVRGCAVIEASPDLGLGSPTIQWLYAAYQAMELFKQSEFPSSVKVPLLLVGAANDQVVSTRAVERLGSELRVGTFLELAGARHEILQERDSIREQFWAAFDAFVPGTPAFAAAG